MSLIQKLRDMVAKAGISDDDILGGMRFSNAGKAKIAKAFGVSEEDAEMMLIGVARMIRQDRMISEDDRFSFESDFLYNVTVRDSKTGKEVFLRGSEASEFNKRMDAPGADAQEILASYFTINEATSRRIAAGCVLLSLSTNKILLGLRAPGVDEDGTWGGWGGMVDRGESLREAVKRELDEEIGYTGNCELTPLLINSTPGMVYYNFVGTVSREFKPNLNWETVRAAWFDLDNLPSPLHPGLEKLFADSRSIAVLRSKMTENVLDEAAEGDADYSDEMSKSGTYNFPWKLDGKRGFATARFEGSGDNMQIKVVSVRDSEGDTVDIDGSAIQDQAVAFIDEA